jgi:uncharacterized protein YdcH (DUF465 family)
MEQGFAQAAERDEALRREFQQQIDGLRREMEQGFAQAAERDEALRREFQQQVEGLRREFQQQIDGLRREMLQQIEGLRGELRRFERLFLAFTVPVILLLAGILLQNFIK